MSHLPEFHPTRRDLLDLAGRTALTVPLAGGAFSTPFPWRTLRVAHVGVGGMGAGDLAQVAKAKDVQIVALCDTDTRRLDHASKQHPAARRFADYRRLLDAVAKDLDAVVVSTPDHMHAPIAAAAMQLGKHVYCQKPLAHDPHETRVLAKLAQRTGVVTQMGIQIHSHGAYRTAVALLRGGIVGKVHSVHLWVGKSWAGPAGGRPKQVDPVPQELSWDLWLGVAPARPYAAKIYHPANWRGWLDFGTGTLGDMGCHIFDPVFAGLELGAPERVVSRGPQHHHETYAADSDITFTLPGTAHTTPKVTLRWTDGRAAGSQATLRSGLSEAVRAHLPKPPAPPEPGAPKIKTPHALPSSGSLVAGERGVLVIPHWGPPRCYRAGAPVPIPGEPLPSRNHYHEWVDACRGSGKTSTPFSYAAPLTEAVLLGCIAGHFRGVELAWDSRALRFENPAAQARVERTYRKGWSLGG
ncbi:MAG: Gfo/Idh/MocA family oxidoreductase [Planctomycetes bacterium]|nr:Gfo/Idh/MocA family oxidoreductase [Planctomycetota bacterium]